MINNRINFPLEVWKEISKHTENQTCCDCSSFDNSWASVSHGSLLCINCAGKHRSLGVSVSCVLSIHMDSWTPMQVECMKYGGNRKLKQYFEKLSWTNRTIVGYYDTEELSLYRYYLRQKVNQIMIWNLINNHSIPPESSLALSKLQKALDFECYPTTHIKVISIEFLAGPIGLTVIRGMKNLAGVSHISPEGPAYCNDIAIGDFLIGCNGCWGDFDVVTSAIHESAHLPMQIHFARMSAAVKRTPL